MLTLAQRQLGTKTKRDTINRALAIAAGTSADDRARGLAWLQDNAEDVLDFEFLAGLERRCKRADPVVGDMVRPSLADGGVTMTAAYDNSDLHELIDHLEPEQVEELRRHALRLVRSTSRFRVLRSFDGPATNLGARAKEIIRAEIGEDDAGR